ncbi:MAG: hypothetical protein JW944_09785, partial [Deltaproteobacteria bacterium]|nr:hypothetical protein [Deltaproteobacteria bacterium]
TAPMGIYLAETYLVNNPSVINGIQLSQIYVFFRNPHHLDIVNQIGKFGSSAQTGVIISILFFILCLGILKSCKDPLLRRVTLLSVIIFCQQFLSLFIAIFDKTGAFLKYYPYRTSSLSFFLMFVILGMLLRRKLFLKGPQNDVTHPVTAASCNRSNMAATLMILCLSTGLCLNLYKNIHDSYEMLSPSQEASARLSFYEWIKHHTPSDAVFLDLNKNARDDLDFIRRAERDMFSVFKFVPTINRLIYDWYIRVLEKRKALADPAYVHKLRQRYRIDYIMSKTPLEDKNFQAVYENDFYFLYR